MLTLSLQKMRLKMSSAKFRPSYLGLNELIQGLRCVGAFLQLAPYCRQVGPYCSQFMLLLYSLRWYPYLAKFESDNTLRNRGKRTASSPKQLVYNRKTQESVISSKVPMLYQKDTWFTNLGYQYVYKMPSSDYKLGPTIENKKLAIKIYVKVAILQYLL